MFQLAGLVYLVGTVVYLVWGSAQLQHWAVREKEGEQEQKQELADQGEQEQEEGRAVLIKMLPGQPSFKTEEC